MAGSCLGHRAERRKRQIREKESRKPLEKEETPSDWKTLNSCSPARGKKERIANWPFCLGFRKSFADGDADESAALCVEAPGLIDLVPWRKPYSLTAWFLSVGRAKCMQRRRLQLQATEKC